MKKIMKNEGLGSLIKLSLNSFSGKFRQWKNKQKHLQ